MNQSKKSLALSIQVTIPILKQPSKKIPQRTKQKQLLKFLRKCIRANRLSWKKQESLSMDSFLTADVMIWEQSVVIKSIKNYKILPDFLWQKNAYLLLVIFWER